MKYKCRFNPIAANEYEGAYSWYFERSIKAAENFVIAIDEAINAICNNPHRYRNSYKELREILIKKRLKETMNLLEINDFDSKQD